MKAIFICGITLSIVGIAAASVSLILSLADGNHKLAMVNIISIIVGLLAIFVLNFSRVFMRTMEKKSSE